MENKSPALGQHVDQPGPKIMTKPLPIILDEMEANIRAAAEAARRAEEAAKQASASAGTSMRAAEVAEKRAEDARLAGENAAAVAKKAAAEAVAKAAEATAKAQEAILRSVEADRAAVKQLKLSRKRLKKPAKKLEPLPLRQLLKLVYLPKKPPDGLKKPPCVPKKRLEPPYMLLRKQLLKLMKLPVPQKKLP
ncbi:Tail fiber protein [Dehalococcoides mccartyi]|uniref:Tail fiber protein n=1 Tax=Dehalococcoides mccartyi TaxID=61435 RepID=A0A328EQK2_9CHLR|nr:Tail fiber protein [Dehalococcoides mccartyi]